MYLKIVLVILVLLFSLPAFSIAEEEEGSLLKKTGKAALDVATEVLETPMKVVKGVLEFALKPIVVTPWGTEEYAFNVSKNVSVITEGEIKNSSATNLPELLSNATGIVVSEQLGNPKGAIVDIRGFGEASSSNVLVMVDGRRTNQIDLSGVDWAQIDLNTIERIEIVRGGSSVLYGDNAAGGVINIITKRGRAAKPSLELGGAIGSNEYHTEYGTFQGSHDIVDYFFSYNHRDEDGYRENNSFKANNWFGRLIFNPVGDFEIETSLGYHKDEYGQPGALYQADLGTIGWRGTRWPDDMATTEDLFLTGVPKVTLKLPNHALTASVHGTYRRRESDSLNVSTTAWHGQTTRTINSGDIRPKIEIDSTLCDNNINNTLIAGTDSFIAVDYKQSGNALAGLDTTKVTKRTNSLYLYDNIELFDMFLLNGGYRYEWADYKFQQKGLLTDHAGKQLNEYAFEIGGGYKYNPSSQVYANYSRSYRYPATEEYHEAQTLFWGVIYGGLNREIRQQVGHNFEVGIKDNSLKWLNVNGDFFLIDTKHELFYDINNAQGNTNYRPRTRRIGFDIEAKANMMDGRIMPYINYTHQRARFHGGAYDNNDITLVPVNKFSAGFTAVPITNLIWNVALNYRGSNFRLNDPGNQVQKLNSYTTVDTKLSYKWKALKIYGSIKNIFNRKYCVNGATNWNQSAITYYPGSGTEFEIGSSMEF